MNQRQLPTETEATAIFVIEGLRNGSPEGRGATANVLKVARMHWDEIPDLAVTLKSVCMVAECEFSETNEARSSLEP